MSRTYLYRILEEELTRIIRSNEYSPHEPLPSYASLMETYGYSIATITRAFDAMEKKGLIYSVHGKGTFVSPPVRSSKILILYPGDGFYRESALFLDGAQKFLYRNNRSYLPVLLPLNLLMEDRENLTHTYPDIKGIIVFRDFDSFVDLERICRPLNISVLFYGSSRFGPSLEYNTYLYDEGGIARIIVDYLLGRGYGKAGALIPGAGDLAEYRMETFRRTARERGLHVEENYVYRGPDEGGAVLSWLGQRSWAGQPLYVPLGRDMTALYPQILRARLSLPEDVGLIGVDRTELSTMKQGAPAFLELPTEGDGGRCVSFLIDLIEKRIGSVRGTSPLAIVPGETLR